MTPSPDCVTLHTYKPGDAARIPVAEEDPFGNWLAHIEANALGLTSIMIDSSLVAVIGFMPVWDGVGDAFALVDRQRAAGHGQALAAAVRRQIIALMARFRLHRVECTADPQDRAAQVFLRATGYRYESTKRCGAPDGSDLLVFTIIRRNPT